MTKQYYFETQQLDADLSAEVYSDIKNFIFSNIADFRDDAKEYEFLDITFATNDAGDTWAFQTGDNSYTGACYSLPHWATFTIMIDTDPLDVYEDITSQLVELLPDNR